MFWQQQGEAPAVGERGPAGFVVVSRSTLPAAVQGYDQGAGELLSWVVGRKHARPGRSRTDTALG